MKNLPPRLIKHATNSKIKDPDVLKIVFDLQNHKINLPQAREKLRSLGYSATGGSTCSVIGGRLLTMINQGKVRIVKI